MDKKTRKRVKAAGMCPSCGARPPAPNRSCCEKCLERARKNAQIRRIKHPDKVKNAISRWHKNNPDKVKANGDRFHRRHPNARRTYYLRQLDRARKIIFGHYGSKCACCGEDIAEFLTIDHIDGNGNKHRRSLNKRGFGFYRWLINQGLPSGYQILCWNCNCAKSIHGVCPHQRIKNELENIHK